MRMLLAKYAAPPTPAADWMSALAWVMAEGAEP